MSEGTVNKVIQERIGCPENKSFVCNQIDYARDSIIEASAGTGKTYTLQSIVLKLLHEKTIDSVTNLLLVTYTEKAAGELKDRIRDVLEKAEMLPPDFDEVTICTIHSFCQQLLSEYAFENRVPMETEICSSDKLLIHQAVLQALHSPQYEADRVQDFAQLMSTADLTADKLVEAVKERFNQRTGLVEDAGKSRDKKKLREAAKGKLVNHLVCLARQVYDANKAETSAMTFDDLVSRTHQIIREESAKESVGETSELLKSIRRKYRIALVDEFQDTDEQQWDIFRSIFSHKVNKITEGPQPHGGFLLVVGDPKQAIYSFRGADIATYLKAKSEIAGEDNKNVHTLDTTYRSSPAMVEAFNRIFGTKTGSDHAWFEDMREGTGSIGYQDVNAPENSAKFKGLKYASGFGAAVELLESLPGRQKNPDYWSTGYGNKSKCLEVFLRNAALEMKRLKALPHAYTTPPDPEKGETERVEHAFSYKDMCILVRGRKDADKAREILSAEGIPFSIYKEQGIYASAEAEALLAVFDFLSAPSRRGRLEAMLLTPFFGYAPAQLESRVKTEDREFSTLISGWQERIVKKEWGALFEGLMTETQYAHPRKDDRDFDRRWSATRQILDRLMDQIGRLAQSVDEFADALRVWRKSDELAGENGALRRKESEADCVQIMTMHVSKGLEFPVVFIAWGFGLLASQAAAEDKEKAIREEKRLLYVALTRAGHKLYLPWSQWAVHRRMQKAMKSKPSEEWEEVGIGSVGSALLIPNAEHLTPASKNPDLGFLARGIRANFKSDDAAVQAVVATTERLAAFKPTEDAPTAESATDAVQSAPVAVYEIGDRLLAGKKLENDSYSSVHKRTKACAEVAGSVSRADEDHGDAMRQKLAPTLLPRNNISGDVFHEIMETLCNNDDANGVTPGFCTVGRQGLKEQIESGDTPLMRLIGKVIRKHQLEFKKDKQGDTTALALARMAWRALNVPITIDGKTFCLKDIPAVDRRAELEFVANRALVLGDERIAEDVPGRDDAFNGKIDLLIRPEGKDGPVYVLDWKTNSLPDYGFDELERSMTASGYHLQYRFYSQAVRYWLKGGRLGGVAYLYVRAGEKSECPDGESGVYVAKTEHISEAVCIEAIKAALNGGN